MENRINNTVLGVDLEFVTHPGIFSPRYLDKGTLAMLSVVEFNKNDKVLDLGCGYGLVGILASKLIGPQNVVMVDNDDRCIEYSKRNAILNNVPTIKIVKSDGVKNLDDTGFTIIVTNPPYHEDFKVPKEFIHKSFNRMKLNGKFYLVAKRLLWYKNKLISIFGGVKIYNINGYYICRSKKESATYAKIENPKATQQKIKRSRKNHKIKLKHLK